VEADARDGHEGAGSDEELKSQLRRILDAVTADSNNRSGGGSGTVAHYREIREWRIKNIVPVTIGGKYAMVPVRDGPYAIIDAGDWPKVRSHWFYLSTKSTQKPFPITCFRGRKASLRGVIFGKCGAGKVSYLNGNSFDCRAANLSYKLARQGVLNGNARCTLDQVEFVKKNMLVMTRKELVAASGIPDTQVGRILSGENWSSVKVAATRPHPFPSEIDGVRCCPVPSVDGKIKHALDANGNVYAFARAVGKPIFDKPIPIGTFSRFRIIPFADHHDLMMRYFGRYRGGFLVRNGSANVRVYRPMPSSLSSTPGTRPRLRF
jgi:hypothetical protein